MIGARKARVAAEHGTAGTAGADASSSDAGAFRLVSSWGRPGRGDGEFYRPSGVALSVSGAYLYVSDGANNRVQCFDSDGAFVRKWGATGSGHGHFDSPIGLAAGADESILAAMLAVAALAAFPPGLLHICVVYLGPELLAVVDRYNHRIQVFRPDGTFVRAWGTRGTAHAEFDSPLGCAVDARGVLYVADTGNHRIQAFDLAGNFLRTWGTSGAGPGQFNQLVSVSITAAERICACDCSNSRLSCFAPDGRFLYHIVISPPTYPMANVLLEEQDALYVCDYEGGGLRQYRRDGTFLRVFGARDVPLTLECPVAVVYHPTRRVFYVADCRTHRIFCIHSSHTP